MENEKIIPLSADVYVAKDGTDCTNNGVTSQTTTVLVVPEGTTLSNYHQIIHNPILIIKRKKMVGDRDYIYAEPIYFGNGKRYMMGGNFIYSCDSRFRQWVSQYPVPVHDRTE